MDGKILRTETLGYLAVGGQPVATPTPTPESPDDGAPVATFVIVAALAVLVIGVVAAVLPGRSSRPAAGAGRDSRRGKNRPG